MDTHFETIGAFIDGERVDADALRAALAIEEGRAYLVELAAMREIVAMPATVAVPAQRSPIGSAKWLLAVAAAILVVASGSFAVGQAAMERQLATERREAIKAPAPTREIPPEAAIESSTIGGL